MNLLLMMACSRLGLAFHALLPSWKKIVDADKSARCIKHLSPSQPLSKALIPRDFFLKIYFYRGGGGGRGGALDCFVLHSFQTKTYKILKWSYLDSRSQLQLLRCPFVFGQYVLVIRQTKPLEV